jgi:hypothetical protein
MLTHRSSILLVLLASACAKPEAPAGGDAAPSTAASPIVESTPIGVTPNELLQGPPTFVVGTTGDARSDRDTAGQARFIAGLFFSDAPILDDTSIDPTSATVSWPPRPVVYGGPHVNALVAALAPVLPFAMTADSLTIGDSSLAGEGLRIITVVPAREADARGPAHPDLLIYAGTGPDGVAEINALGQGADAIAIADGFGMLRTGHWGRTKAGEVVAVLGPATPRLEWRAVERSIAAGTTVTFHFPADTASSDEDEAIIAAGQRGLARAIDRLQIAKPVAMSFYVYRDGKEKQRVTGDGGDGHAVPSARALHVRRADTSEGGGMENLVAHEGTHVLVREPWGPAGSPLLGEGVAVWSSGGYAGSTIAQWKPQITVRPIAELLGKTFFRTPERESYPFAGLVVEVAIAEVGLDAVRDHLYGATARTWPEACVAAGTTAEALDAALARATIER